MHEKHLLQSFDEYKNTCFLPRDYVPICFGQPQTSDAAHPHFSPRRRSIRILPIFHKAVFIQILPQHVHLLFSIFFFISLLRAFWKSERLKRRQVEPLFFAPLKARGGGGATPQRRGVGGGIGGGGESEVCGGHEFVFGGFVIKREWGGGWGGRYGGWICVKGLVQRPLNFCCTNLLTCIQFRGALLGLDLLNSMSTCVYMKFRLIGFRCY